jgi:FkbM family methyltransferase
MNPHRAFENAPIAQKALPGSSGNFRRDFLAVVAWCIDNCWNDRDPRVPFGAPREPYLEEAARQLGPQPAKGAMLDYSDSVVIGAIIHWEWLYEHLEDWDSKALLLDVLAYRTIGWRYVKMPLDSDAYWNGVGALAKLHEISPLVKFDHGPQFWLLDLSEQGYNVKVLSEALGVFNEFIYSQYQYRGRRVVLGPKWGDYVLDCGACYGGTSLYFADMVGPNGKVITFEFFPDNIKVLKRNISENPTLAPRIDLHEAPVWHTNRKSMFIEFGGPAAQVYEADSAKNTGALQVISTTIDETCKDLPRVDFIKADIEGSELYSLFGAQETLKRHGPTLAMCVYHKLIDFYETPKWLDDLNLGYKFYLQHSSIHGDETVLFADARGR